MVGPPFWVAQRLIGIAAARWPEFHGIYLLRTGREPLLLPLPSLLDAVYAWWTWGGTQKEIAKFDAELAAPPEHVDLEQTDGWGDEELLDDFSAQLEGLRAVNGGGGRPRGAPAADVA